MEWTAEQWRRLAACLGYGPLRGRFKKNLITIMKKRDQICIKCLADEVAEGLGGEYGLWADEILIAASKETSIEVYCGKGKHNA